MVKLKVIGYANRPNCYERNWSASLLQCRYDYQLIGQNEKWKGWITRPKAYLEYLQAESSNETIYVFTDVHDVVANNIINASEEYITKFQQINKSIIIGAEPGCPATCCRPLTNYWNDNEKKLPNIHINWGLVSGYRDELIDFMEYLINDYEQFSQDVFSNNLMLRILYKGREIIWNEQIVTRRYMDLHPNLFHLDCTSQFIGNILCHPVNGNVKQYTRRDDKIFNKQYDTYPFFVHTPASNIDGFRRYNHYVSSILKGEYEKAENCMNVLGYHTVIIGITILLVVIISLCMTFITNRRIISIVWIVAIAIFALLIILVGLYYNALKN